ncbi:OmpP1/FadL family transporter [Georhizobium sp. MAB10]|jgi:long-chain fatty acid transport protein|uniref:OmpP1/FadL family transporter n=1 Tax=Georhizobium sp. MAB10 TaxID=3028319 RepID=UPI003855F844
MKRALLISTALGVALSASQAFAGGLERGGYNIDLLFDPSDYAADASVTYVMPKRDLENVRDINPANGVGSNGIGGGRTSGVRDTESYAVPRVGFKAGFAEAADCLVQYSQPWGAHSNPGADWVGANSNIETKIDSHSADFTCSYRFAVGPGQFRIIGGGYYQEVEGFKERLVAPVPLLAPGAGSGVGRLDLEGNGWGYRVGAAYEMPEIALRASLVYNSEVDLGDVTGTLDLRQVPGAINPANPFLGRVTDVFGTATMPQSVELKVQSGIAPGWLAFGSVKWVDWSVLQTLPFCPTAFSAVPCTAGGPTQATSLELLYQDGWTVSAGIGHKFSETISGAASLTWDRGTATTLGTQTDTWTVSGGLSYTPSEMVELRFGGALGVLTSGSSIDDDVAYDFGNDFVGAIQAGARIRF